MARGISDRGIILRRNSFGEADIYITVFSKDHGKLRILAKGARKTSSKFMGHVEPLSIVKFSAVYGKSFLILTSATLEKSFRELKKNTEKTNMALYMAEVIDILNPENDPDQRIYELFMNTLNEKMGERDKSVFMFLFDLLILTGFLPNFESCTKCGGKISKEAYFSFYWGGLICPSCNKTGKARKLDRKVIESLAKAGDKNIKDNIDEDFAEEKRLLKEFVDYINDKKIKSSKYA